MPHLHYLALENFRLFKEKTEFEFAPITILTGTNSSGKSSLIKGIKLLKGSFENSKWLSELLFREGNHHLGTFESTANYNSKHLRITFTLRLPIALSDEPLYIRLTYRPSDKYKETGVLCDQIVIYSDSKIIIDFDGNVDIEKITNNITEIKNNIYTHHVLKIDLAYFVEIFRNKVNQFELKPKEDDNITDDLLSEEYKSRIQRKIFDKTNCTDSVYNSFWSNKSLIRDDDLALFNEAKDVTEIFINEDNFPENEFKKKTLKLLNNFKNDGFIFCYDVNNLQEFELFPYNSISWVLDYLQDDHIIQRVFDLKISDFGKYVLKLIYDLINESREQIQQQFNNVTSLSSIRGNTLRLYDNKSDVVSINSIILDYLELPKHEYEYCHSFVKFGLNLFNIGDDIEIKRIGGVASEIMVFKGDSKILLADLGYGYTQIIPLILKIAIKAKNRESNIPLYGVQFRKSTFIIEEPESNLHPALQSKLADLFIEAGRRFNMQFIIETHSEYLIRRMQFLVASNHYRGKKKDVPEISSKDVKIFYFNENKPDEKKAKSSKVKKEQVYEITIKNDGSLSRPFGPGFYDVVDDVALEMFLLRNQSKN